MGGDEKHKSYFGNINVFRMKVMQCTVLPSLNPKLYKQVIQMNRGLQNHPISYNVGVKSINQEEAVLRVDNSEDLEMLE